LTGSLQPPAVRLLATWPIFSPSARISLERTTAPSHVATDRKWDIMSNDNQPPALTPEPALRQLDRFVGTWTIDGPLDATFTGIWNANGEAVGGGWRPNPGADPTVTLPTTSAAAARRRPPGAAGQAGADMGRAA
jgi:hypothetical protein